MANRIGRFELAELLGEGAFGQFYRGHDPATGRGVVVQIVKLIPKVSAEARDTALREARAAGALSHPNVSAIYDIGIDGEVAYVVREFVDGRSLMRYAAEGAPFHPVAVIPLLEQIADALDYAHKTGIVHGALEPTYVLVTPEGRAKVTGFGTSKVAAKAAGALGGSPEYMSPEKIRGEAIGPAADVYSLGAIVYELVTGTRPFASDSAVTTIFKAVNEPPPSLAGVAPGANAGVDAVVRRALAKAPSERYATCGELVDSLRAAVEEPRSGAAEEDDAGGLVEAIFCDQCGAALRPSVKFCYKCGAAAVAPVVSTPPVVSEPGPEPEPVFAAPVPAVAAHAPVVAEPVPEHIAEPEPVVDVRVEEHVSKTEVAEAIASNAAPDAIVLPTEKAPALVVGRPVAPPLAAYAHSRKGGELPPPGADLSGKPKSGFFSGVVPIVIVLLLILFLVGLFGFMIAPRLLTPKPAPQQQTSSVATFVRPEPSVTSSAAWTVL
jgi:serine/threonine-protein kinase